MADFDIAKALASVYSRINAVCLKKALEVKPRLVAVSKTKPKDLVIEAYENGQRHFGENYVQELVEKSTDPELLDKCKEIKWHFIGNLQRNKVNKVVTAPNLFMVETVDSEKLASALDTAWEKLKKAEPLNVMVQVNTSQEESKGGIPPESSCDLVQFVVEKCKSLKFIGLMTIGQYDYDVSKGPNPDFLSLVDCKNRVSQNLNIEVKDIELSMGMSTDYEHAIELGSTSIRVGTSIFGSRNLKAGLVK